MFSHSGTCMFIPSPHLRFFFIKYFFSTSKLFPHAWMQTDLTTLSEDTIKSMIKENPLSVEEALSLIDEEKRGRGRKRVIEFLAIQARKARSDLNLKYAHTVGIHLPTVSFHANSGFYSSFHMHSNAILSIETLLSPSYCRWNPYFWRHDLLLLFFCCCCYLCFFVIWRFFLHLLSDEPCSIKWREHQIDRKEKSVVRRAGADPDR